MVKNYLPLRTTETLIVLICYISLCAFEAETAPIHPYAQTAQFLARYGYLTPDRLENFGTTWPEPLFEAIADYQSFIGIHATGYINPETARSMTMPRCGVKDKTQTGSAWPSKDMTYKIRNYPTKLKPAAVDAEIARAFAAWSEHTDLAFSPRSEPKKVDIDISFLSGYHGDDKPFDGPSNSHRSALGHADFPEYGGGVHFDNDENWSINSFRGIDLYYVAMHEFGHSLGLDHSKIKSSVMYPKYMQELLPNAKLDDDDIRRIQVLYGPKTNRRTDATDSGNYEGSSGDAEGDGVEGSDGDAESDGVEGSGGDVEGNGVEGSGGDAESDGVEGSGADVEGDGVEGSGGDAESDGVEGSGGNVEGDGVEGSGSDVEGDGIEGSGGDAESDGVEGSGGDAESDGVEGSGGNEENDANHGISESSYDDSSDFYFGHD